MVSLSWSETEKNKLLKISWFETDLIIYGLVLLTGDRTEQMVSLFEMDRRDQTVQKLG